MEFSQRHDAMLSEILDDKKSIVDFLETIFSFLARRTDFYCEMKNPTDTMGFPEGVKEKLVFSTLRKFDPKYVTISSNIDPAPPAVEEIEVETTTEKNDIIIPNQETSTNAFYENEVKIENSDSKNKSTTKAKLKPCFQLNEYYNGGKFDTYCWSQTMTDLEVHVILPEHIKSAKDLNVKILSNSITIHEKCSDNVLLEGKLHGKCKNNDAVWSILSGKLQITLDKVTKKWWDQFLDNEPKLDLSKMDCSRFIDELPDDTQATIEKLRWDEHQKMLGLPTSDDVKNMELLRKAWDLEGSPFKGQPFDPSAVKFNS